MEIVDRVWYPADACSTLLARFLLPLSWGYGAAVSARNVCYSRGVFSVRTVSVPVISVGNLTVGGTGKTPLVAYLANLLRQRGFNPVVVTRGYKKQGGHRHPVLVDLNIKNPAVEFGDEACLLARGIPVVVAPDRVAGANFACHHHGGDVVILDDGFQHRRLARQLDIVTVDSMRLAGNGYLLPSGPLREPLKGLMRAQVIVYTRVNLCQPPQIQRLSQFQDMVTNQFPTLTQIVSQVRLNSPVSLEKGHAHQLSPGVSMWLCCGIGNPTSFYEAVTQAGYSVAGMTVLPDHASLNINRMAEITKTALNHGAQAVAVTTKDAIKLPVEFQGSQYWYEFPMVIQCEGEEQAWFKCLHAILSEHKAGDAKKKNECCR